MLITVAIFLIVLGLLIFVHEFGHFYSARKMGMKVEEFGFGFPPKIWSKKGKDGVIYSVNAIPLGGYCKIKGEEGEDRTSPDSFASKKPWRRAIVLISGVLMNFLLCVFLLSLGFMIGLPQAVDQSAIEKGLVKDYKIQVVSVLEGKPAKAADIQIGDIILAVDGKEIKGIKNLVSYTTSKLGQKVTYKLSRGQEILTKEIEIIDIGQGRGGIGIGLIETGIVSYPFHNAVWHGFKSTVLLTKEFVLAFANLIKNLIIGKTVDVQVSGPVGIAVLTGQVAKLGFIYILQFTALLSLNLAIINFMPFPALDGGRLLFLLIEKIRRRSMTQKIETLIHTIGFAILMILIIIVTFQDILRYFDFSKLFGWFFQ